MSKEPITIPSGQLDAQIAPKQKMVYLLKLPPLHFTAEHNVRWHRIDPWLVWIICLVISALGTLHTFSVFIEGESERALALRKMFSNS